MSSEIVAKLLAKNQEAAGSYKSPPLLTQGILKRKQAGKKATVIISCSDPRITPEHFMGLAFGEAAIIRNAGGRAKPAVRDILALDAVGDLGTVAVIHHTDCGMSHMDEQGFQDATNARHGETMKREGIVELGAIPDPDKTIVEDVEFLRSFPSLTENMEIVGFVLDTHTGLVKVADA